LACLWGLPGLLLATSLTGCLKVVGDYIPALGFLSIILGTKRLHEDYHDYYRVLLELDSPGARAFAIRYCDKNGLQRTFYDVLLPTLILMGEERREERDSPEVRLIIDTSRQLVMELGNRFAKPPASGSVRVPGVMAPDDPHDLGLLTLIELLRQDGGSQTWREHERPPPRFASSSSSMGCSQVCANSDEARRAVQRYKHRRVRAYSSTGMSADFPRASSRSYRATN
jgi:hypothetical protein